MRKPVQIALVFLIVSTAGLIAWRVLRVREPVYQGKQLNEWLQEYNRLGDISKIGPANEAMRGLGTNAFPFLLSYIKHRDSALASKLFRLLAKQHVIKLPFYGENVYYAPALLAIKALGQDAKPLVPEFEGLLATQQDREAGAMALFFAGPVSIPSLEQACRYTNAQARAEAAFVIAKIKQSHGGVFGWGWGWHNSPINGKPLLFLGYSAMGDSDQAIAESIARNINHPDPAIRLANIDALRIYTGPLIGSAKVAVAALIKASSDGNPMIAEAAGKALKQINPEAATKAGLK